MRCAGTALDGKPCRAEPLDGADLCAYHARRAGRFQELAELEERRQRKYERNLERRGRERLTNEKRLERLRGQLAAARLAEIKRQNRTAAYGIDT